MPEQGRWRRPSQAILQAPSSLPACPGSSTTTPCPLQQAPQVQPEGHQWENSFHEQEVSLREYTDVFISLSPNPVQSISGRCCGKHMGGYCCPASRTAFVLLLSVDLFESCGFPPQNLPLARSYILPSENWVK